MVGFKLKTQLKAVKPIDTRAVPAQLLAIFFLESLLASTRAPGVSHRGELHVEGLFDCLLRNHMKRHIGTTSPPTHATRGDWKRQLKGARVPVTLPLNISLIFLTP